MSKKRTEALRRAPDGDLNDYIMNPEYDSVWIEMHGFIIYLYRDTDGIIGISLSDKHQGSLDPPDLDIRLNKYLL